LSSRSDRRSTYLPVEVAEAKDTNGRSAIATLAALDDPPEEVMVTTAGISLAVPEQPE
jgi:hypothetical protein